MAVLNLVFIGKPGSGKGTELALMVERGYIGISMGDLLRDFVKQDTPLSKQVKKTMDEGKLVSDDLVMDVLKQSITRKHGLILDGFPRTVNAACALEKMLKKNNMILDAVIEISKSNSLIIKRLSGRYMCTKCGAIYNKCGKNTKKKGICDICGNTQFYQRDDDKPEAIERRIKIFEEQSKPIIEFYKKKGIYYKVSGNTSNIIDCKVMKIVEQLLEE